jgi:hypothetical protein
MYLVRETHLVIYEKKKMKKQSMVYIIFNWFYVVSKQIQRSLRYAYNQIMFTELTDSDSVTHQS